MPNIGSSLRKISLLVTLVLVTSTGCSTQSSEPIRTVQIQQNWELQPGTDVAGHRVAGSLGDVSIELKGDRFYAPFDGRFQPSDIESCAIFSSPEVPAYLFRLCGVKNPKYGQVKQGAALGSADYLQFAALRRQPDGKWAMVEPAKDILERTLTKP